MRNRNLLAKALVGIALAGLVGCATAGRLAKLRVGMSKAEVYGVLGAPDSSSAQDGVEVLHYSLPEDFERALYLATDPYFVRLTNGKVDAYGRKDALPGGPPDESQAMKLLSELKSARPPAPAPASAPSASPVGAPPAPAGYPAPAAVPEDIEAKLTKLKKLADGGLITPAEYEEQKKYLLSEFISR